MKKQLNEIFKDIFSPKKVPVNFWGGMGGLFFSFLLLPHQNYNIITEDALLEVIKTAPLTFTIGFIIGYIYTNMHVKEINEVTAKKIYLLTPLIAIWILSIVIFAK